MGPQKCDRSGCTYLMVQKVIDGGVTGYKPPEYMAKKLVSGELNEAMWGDSEITRGSSSTPKNLMKSRVEATCIHTWGVAAKTSTSSNGCFRYGARHKNRRQKDYLKWRLINLTHPERRQRERGDISIDLDVYL